MDKYYYLISSLPLLKFIEPPPITTVNFIIEAGKWLSREDLAILSNVGINNFIPDRQEPSLLKEYKELEYSIRQELSLFRRAKKQNIEYKIRKDIAGIIQENNNPLEVERGLLLLRWDFLEEREIDHFFDLDFLIIYYLKLQILERVAGFSKQQGKQRFEAFSRVEL